MYYVIDRQVNSYDCDCKNTLKLSAVLKFMQQASSEQFASLGLPVEKLLKEGLAFLFSKITVKIERMPVCNETLHVGTALTMPKGARFMREFIIEAPDGQRLISALSEWLLVNADDHKLLRPSSFLYPLTFQPEQLNALSDIAYQKNVTDKTLVYTQPICYSHIDVNHHVNNAVYADFICDALPYETLKNNAIDNLSISFKKEALPGDILQIYLSQQEKNNFYIEGAHDRGICFSAFVHFA